jgi:hypothetical protein
VSLVAGIIEWTTFVVFTTKVWEHPLHGGERQDCMESSISRTIQTVVGIAAQGSQSLADRLQIPRRKFI